MAVAHSSGAVTSQSDSLETDEKTLKRRDGPVLRKLVLTTWQPPEPTVDNLARVCSKHRGSSSDFVGRA